MNSDDDVTSSSSDEGDIYEPTAEEVAEMMRLEAEVEANPNSYETHVAYVQLLSHCRLRERARLAREALVSRFPLTEALWQAWVQDEAEAARTSEDVARIERLFGRAHEDLLSIPLLAEHLEFVASYEPAVTGRTPEGMARYRALAEEVLTKGGLHVAGGGKLFKVIRAFEFEDGGGTEGGGAASASTDRIRQLYQRQLALPLLGNDEVMAEFRAWLAAKGLGDVPESVAQAAARAQEMLDQRRSYEEAIAEGKPADTDLLAAFLAYIQLEEMAGDPLRACVLYERAVAAFPMTSELWLRYTRYVEAHVKSAAAVHATYARALRHCPWAGSLWSKALRAMERWTGKGATEEDTDREHVALYGRALMGGWLAEPEEYLEVMLARLDYLRRRGAGGAAELRETFGHATETMSSLFPEFVDRSLRLPAYWAKCETTALGSVEAGRAVWESAIKGPLGRYSEGWMGYIEFEQHYGTADKVRQLFKRAYSRRLEGGGQLRICEGWLRWEREEGSAEDLAQAQFKVDPMLAEARAAAAAALDEEMAERARKAADKAPKLSREEMIRMRREKDPNYGKSKRKRGPEGEAEGAGPSAAAEGPAAEEKPDNGGAAPPAKKARADRSTSLTAFVVNLGFKTDEEAIRTFFNSVSSGVTDVRIVRDAKTQQPKGRAYVDFETQEQLNRAISEANGKILEGRALTVMISKPSTGGGDGPKGGGGSAPAQASGHQQHQAYLKNIPDDATEDSLRALFTPFGGIKAIRIVRDHGTGRPKGFAYLDLDSAEALESAIKELNGKDLGGKGPLIVAPAKNQQGSTGQGASAFPTNDTHGGGGAGRGGGRGPRPTDAGPRHSGLGFGGRGRGRGVDQLDGTVEAAAAPPSAPPTSANMFRPRNVAVGVGKGTPRAAIGAKTASTGAAPSAQPPHEKTEDLQGTEPGSGGMSNSEFRKYLS